MMAGGRGRRMARSGGRLGTKRYGGRGCEAGIQCLLVPRTEHSRVGHGMTRSHEVWARTDRLEQALALQRLKFGNLTSFREIVEMVKWIVLELGIVYIYIAKISKTFLF